MYWFSRPPYWRWIAAVVILLAAAYMDLAGPATEAYPFAAETVAIGEPVDVDWRHIPTGVLPAPGLVDGVAAVPIAAGTPLTDSLLERERKPPDGWWALAVDLPLGAVRGTATLLVLPDREVTGIVVAVGSADAFGTASPGMVAVPPEHAAAIAAATLDHRLTVLIEP